MRASGEGGLLGLAVDPEFEENRFVYLYRTRAPEIDVARYRFESGELSEEAIVLDGIRAGPIHDSGRLHFGPDGDLYVSTGDAGQAEVARDRGSRNGKFIRLSPEAYRGRGGEPEVFSLGHRNAQGFDWEPEGGRLIATEHGEDANDEVNVVRRGRDYGWPDVQGRQSADGVEEPAVLYEQTLAPSGATFVSLPGSSWTGDYLFAALAGEQLRRLRFDGDGTSVDEPLLEGRFGRLRTVVEGPDGALYVLTSNRDGRGAPASGDDRIIRVVPPEG